jgi:glycine cleavage system regulatory protein
MARRFVIRRTQAEEDASKRKPQTRAELQAAAKAAGIPANQSTEALREALEQHER